MHFFKSVLVAASVLAGSGLAVSDALGFTKALSGVTTGKEVDLQYKAAQINMPVKIVLRKGKAEDLKTIATLANNAVGGSFHWTPAKNLVSGNDYALYIKQGNEDNFYGPFAIKGADMPAYGGPSSPTASASPSPYLPAPAATTAKEAPLATASGSPAPYPTGPRYSFAASGGMPHGMNVTIQGTGTGNAGPTKTQLTYVSPTITAATSATPTETNAAGIANRNLGLAVGLFGLLAYLN